jgi:hypothetical protein
MDLVHFFVQAINPLKVLLRIRRVRPFHHQLVWRVRVHFPDRRPHEHDHSCYFPETLLRGFVGDYFFGRPFFHLSLHFLRNTQLLRFIDLFFVLNKLLALFSAFILVGLHLELPELLFLRVAVFLDHHFDAPVDN